ncbi:MAG: STAS domain-containing protein [Chloroflexaceae bacterium]|nr:STAS domain-containing protein [Chloroflexaceae bacterium]
MGVLWGVHYVSGKFAGWFSHHFETNCWATQRRFVTQGDPYDEFVVEPSSRLIEEELETIEREEHERQLQLEELVEQRTAQLSATINELQQAQSALRMQARLIQEIGTPVVQIWHGVLMVPMVGVIDNRRAMHLTETVLSEISNRAAQVVLIDITGVINLDTEVANYLMQTMRAITLLGAYSALVGISPAIAQTMVTLGIELGNLTTFANLQQGLEYAFQRIGIRLCDGHVPLRER